MKNYFNLLVVLTLMAVNFSGSYDVVAKEIKVNKASMIDAIEEKRVLAKIDPFYLATVLPLSDKKVERKFVAELIQSPPMPPVMKIEKCQSVARQLLKNSNQASLQALTLYGGVTLLQSNKKQCWSIHYDSLLSGGVSFFVDKLTYQFLLIVLSPEG